MSVWFCSDLHFGHEKIGKFRNEILDEGDNRNRIIQEWKDCVSKRDDVYVLGDVAFTMDTVGDFADLKGRKHLVRGNHDKLDTQVYLKYFEGVYGLLKYKEFWLSHAPIHPDELRGRVNLHGHVHYHSVDDKRYFNCCVENLWKLKGRALIRLEEIREYLKQ